MDGAFANLRERQETYRKAQAMWRGIESKSELENDTKVQSYLKEYANILFWIWDKDNKVRFNFIG